MNLCYVIFAHSIRDFVVVVAQYAGLLQHLRTDLCAQGGGPGNTTTFLSIDLVKIALGQFDLGPAAAMSIIYFLIILFLSWLFYTLMMKNEET